MLGYIEPMTQGMLLKGCNTETLSLSLILQFYTCAQSKHTPLSYTGTLWPTFMLLWPDATSVRGAERRHMPWPPNPSYLVCGNADTTLVTKTFADCKLNTIHKCF
ncbi:hypothetical protein GOP47_0010949 [Adiantum capillus-veneris]|uniref:Uncharacterized protein n=1 Tax=Adiantum capillus-veneris TaxID=13818 RepID=A0A9D4UWV2_ADICA|nr:hypothetical protein GOP47_0010949 [Adiantum capillus-veneris]